MSLWDLYDDIKGFKNAPKEKQQEVLDELLKEENAKHYNFAWMLNDVVRHLDAKTSLKVFQFYITKGGPYSLDNDYMYNIAHEVYKHKRNKTHVKKFLIDSNTKRANRALLMLDGLTEAEEEKGLRALATTKYAPDCIHSAKYIPSKNVIKKLPPVMRLNVLETLSRETHLAYNIFKNLGDNEEFQSLLFGAVLRHNTRVEKLIERHKEVSGLGNTSTVTIKSTCPNCGDYEIVITSKRINTRSSMKKTRMRGLSEHTTCAMCGKYTNITPTFIEDEG